MSEYTISLYNLIKSGFDIGMKDYAIFNEEYRPILNNAIVMHYLMREICYQNPEYWKIKFNQRLDMIMRNKYNALYKLKETNFNPLYNIELHETYTRSVDSTGNDKSKVTTKSTGENSNDNLSLSSRFPSEEMTENDLTSNIYVDNANKDKGKDSYTSLDDNTSEAENTSNMLEEYTHTTEGSSAGLPFSKAMIQFKEYIEKFKLDEQVIADLGDLFMNVW